MTANHITPRMFLAMEMQRAREARGLKTDEVAKAVFVSDPLVRSWEKGRRIPQPDNLTQVEDLYGPEALRGILCRFREKLINSGVPPEWMGEWREIERGSASLLSFQTNVVPGLLQTEGYASAVFEMCKHLGDVEKMTKDRLARQSILTPGEEAEPPPTVVVLLSEAVLVSMIGGPAIMRAQLEHLIEVALAHDHIFLHVIPFTTPVNAGFIAPFVIANTDGTDVAYVDDQLRGALVEEPENVAILRHMFERFRAHALSQPDSLELIRKVIEERWTL